MTSGGTQYSRRRDESRINPRSEHVRLMIPAARINRSHSPEIDELRWTISVADCVRRDSVGAPPARERRDCDT